MTTEPLECIDESESSNPYPLQDKKSVMKVSQPDAIKAKL